MVPAEPILILSIEDDPIMRMINKKIIDAVHPSLSYMEAFHGQHAFEILKDLKAQNKPFPAIILCDLDMPIINGFEFIKLFQNNFSIENTEIIVVSSSETKADISLCHALGIKYILQKPITKNDLESNIAEIIAKG